MTDANFARVIDALAEHEPVSARVLTMHLYPRASTKALKQGLSNWPAYLDVLEALKQAERLGIVRRTGAKRGQRWHLA